MDILFVWYGVIKLGTRQILGTKKNEHEFFENEKISMRKLGTQFFEHNCKIVFSTQFFKHEKKIFKKIKNRILNMKSCTRVIMNT